MLGYEILNSESTMTIREDQVSKIRFFSTTFWLYWPNVVSDIFYSRYSEWWIVIQTKEDALHLFNINGNSLIFVTDEIHYLTKLANNTLPSLIETQYDSMAFTNAIEISLYDLSWQHKT